MRRVRSSTAGFRAAPAVAALVVTVVAAAPAGATATTLIGQWSEPERAAVVRALAGVPDVVRRRLPVVVARDAASCDAEGLPDDDALVDRRGVVHLCTPAADATADGVARQVTLGLLFAFDLSSRWSEDPAWRRLSRWRPGLSSGLRPRAENVGAAAFAHARGRRSPRWDLTTYLAAAWLDAPDAAGGVACRLMSQAAFVRGRLADLGGGALPPPVCPLFERWADLDRLADVEVVLAEPSTAMAGSLFGHVFLRLVYRDDAGETPPHLSRTVAFLADNDVPFEADRGYALKGIAGFYTASLHERAFLEAFREYAVTEGRDLRRWRLAFTPAERAALMARLWTVLGGARYDYYFFRQNCATLMMELLDEARAPSLAVGRAGVLAAPPASTLEAWAAARGADGGALLVEVPEPVLSFDHEARLTSRHRLALEPRLLARAAPGRVAALAEALRAARSSEPRTRAAAYGSLAALFEGAAPAAEEVAAWLRDSAAIEAHLSVVANLQEEARADARRRERVRVARDALAAALTEAGGAIAVVVGRVSDDDLGRRLEGYRELRALIAAPEHAARVNDLRLLALLESEVRYDVVRLKRDPALRDALLFADPEKAITEQPYLAGREDLITLAVVTSVAPPLLALQRARTALAVGAAPESSLAAPARDEQQAASLPRSGIDQLAVSAGAVAAAGGAAGALVLGGALYDEGLGDHRRFGFPSDTAFVVGRSDVWLSRGEGGSFVPSVAAYDARVFGYRSLRLPLPEAGGGRWPVGWQLFLDLAGSRARAVSAEARAGWGVLLPLFDRDELSQHVIAGVGLAYVGVFPTAAAFPAERPQALALPVSFELRAALGARPAYRSWLAARVVAEPAFVVAGAARSVATTARANVELHLALGAPPAAGAHDPALLVRIEALRTSLTTTAARADSQALLSLGVELR